MINALQSSKFDKWAYITTHNGRLVASCPPPQLGLIRQITLKYKKIKNLKFIDKVEQSVYIRVFKSAEFKNGIYFVLGSLIHCVLAWFLSEVSSMRQIVVGWIFRNIPPWFDITTSPNAEQCSKCNVIAQHQNKGLYSAYHRLIMAISDTKEYQIVSVTELSQLMKMKSEYPFKTRWGLRKCTEDLQYFQSHSTRTGLFSIQSTTK